MATQAVEYSTFTFDITEGVAVDGATIGTIGGVAIGYHLTRTKSKSKIHSYQLIVTHDTVGTTILEYSVRQATITNGDAFAADTVFRTNEGAGQASAVIAHTRAGEKTTYDIVVIHLDA